MSDLYTRMAATSKRLLAPTSQGGLGQGEIVLVRRTPAPPSAQPWDPPGAPTETRNTLQGASSGVGKELIGTQVSPETQIVATDLKVIVAPFDAPCDPGDVLELDGAPATILAVENIPAVGITVAVRLIVRR